MKKTSILRKILAVVLAVLTAASLTVSSFAAKAEKGDDYSTVFIHGLLGWGDEDAISSILSYWGIISGNMPQYLKKNGYDVFVASVGSISSAHDRCCELFAQLTGSRVDYGQAHADKCSKEFSDSGYTLKHDRYGKDYNGDRKIENWGPMYDKDGKVTGWYDNKVNLVGHSFGGPTSLEFVHLLANGDPDEIAWGKAQAQKYGGDWHDYISPLFWGDYDGEYLVNSITSIAGVLNGTTFITANDDAMDSIVPFIMYIANLTGKTNLGDLYNFQLEQFGIKKKSGQSLEETVSAIESLGFNECSDNAYYDLSTAGTNILKRHWNTYDNIYYFSYSGNKTYKVGECYLPDADMFIMFPKFSKKIGSYQSETELVYNVDGTVYSAIDSEWLKNDGMVNTISARYPFGTAHKEYNPNSIESGVWNVHPDSHEDHLGIIGGLTVPRPAATKKFYDGVMADIARTKPISDSNKVSIGSQLNKVATPQFTSARRNILKKVTLNWQSVNSCYYEIYRSTSANGTFTRIDTTLLTTYTDLTAKSGTTYYYKLVAVPLTNNFVSSEFSSPVSVK